ncbi:GABA transporter 1 [Nymphaea colorata]|nr:GABA transporter 1 [Nymphaea colorata]
MEDKQKRAGEIREEGATGGQKLDAGALFVLKSRGSWVHCGYHLTTSIVAPPLLSLPFAFATLGWAAAVACLTLGGLVTFYSYNLLSLVLEHHAALGNRHLRFRDMANDILGPRWGRFFVGPLQFAACFGAVVGNILLGGQSMKFIYVLYNPNGTMKLYEFVAILGVVMVVLTQMPSFHSLRHINLVSLFLCLAYSACAASGSIYSGLSGKAGPRDYSRTGNSVSQLFGAFNGVAVIATSYGNGIIPEIQATLAPPVKGKMMKGLFICYSVVVTTFFSVAVSGYWAFGNKSQGSILSNFMVQGQPPLLPRSFLFFTYLCTLLQVVAVVVVYLQPTNEILERKLADPNSGQFSMRNVIPRVIARSLAAIFATLIAAMLPFFGDINALIGAFGFIPLDFVLPMIFYNVTFMPSKKSTLFWLNTIIAAVFSAIGVIALVSAVRQIILDAHTYRLFANL